MITAETYNFGRPYQTKLLALCIRDRCFLKGNSDSIKPQWFDDDTHADFCRWFIEFLEQHGTAPTFAALEQMISDITKESDPKRWEKRAEYIKAAEELANVEIDEAEDVRKRAGLFAKRQAVQASLVKGAMECNDNEFSKMAEDLRRALLVGESRANLGVNYFTDKTRFDKDRSRHTISTGLPSLDRLLLGGSAPEELCIIEAPTNKFKTGAMVNLSIAALYQGCDVVFASLEDPFQNICRRFDGALLGLVTSDCTPEHVFREVQKRHADLMQNLWVRDWGNEEATIDDLRAWIHALAEEKHILTGKRRLFIVVDYGGIIRPAQRYSEKRHEIRDNYRGLLRMASEFEAPVWSGMQTNRLAERKKLITKADLAECYAVAGDAHIILSLNQDRDEEEAGEMRCFVAKAKNAKAFKHVDLLTNLDLTKWSEPISGGDHAKSREHKRAPSGAAQDAAPLDRAKVATRRLIGFG